MRTIRVGDSVQAFLSPEIKGEVVGTRYVKSREHLVGGVATGTAGLVIKPISGVMDVVTKTSHGINNATKTNEELERSWDARIRPPRPFYEAERLIRPYDKRHAELLRIVPKLNFNMV